jgi:hypothetical protein
MFEREIFFDGFEFLKTQDIHILVPVMQPLGNEVLPDPDGIDVIRAYFHHTSYQAEANRWASRMASIMLLGSAIPFPAMSKAVP